MDFRKYLKEEFLKPDDSILEFGPLTRPTVQKETHPNIKYADIRSTEDIKKLYTTNDYLKSTGLSVDLDSVVEIDHVVKGSYKESFRGVDKFDVVILSHVIEHMTDIVDFFEDITHVLKRSGRLVIIYPDAKYCFDHFRNGTTFIDAYDVYKNKNHSSNRVFDFVYNVVKENNPNVFWNDIDKGALLPENSFNKALKARENALKNKLPDDTHFWPFSDYQLIKFFYDMDRAGLFKFDIEEFYPTEQNTQECMVILKLKNKKTVDVSLYKDLFNKVSPAVKEIKQRKENDSLQDKLNLVEDENKRLKEELTAVYQSKKWRYAEKVAITKNKLLGKDGNK